MAKMTKAKIALLAVGIVLLVVSSALMVSIFENLGDRPIPLESIRVACIGDSITEGSGYPADLQIMLGPEYDVRNFGVSGSTVSLSSDLPYMNQTAHQKSKAFQPSIVIIMLGTNDAQESTYESIENFSVNYKKLIAEYTALGTNPTVWLVTPPPIFDNDLYLNNTKLEEGVIPQIDQVANDLNLPTIDVNMALANYDEYFMDGVHPSSEGATLIANEIGEAIISNGE